MLTFPTKYTQGSQGGSKFTGAILYITGVDQLFGNVETDLDEGHVYNVVKSWSGIQQSIDVFSNTYSKPTPSFTLSNVIYRKSSGADNKVRVSDDLADIVGSVAYIYYVNNVSATALTDCLRVFSGYVKSVSDYDDETIKITLESKAIIGDSKILNSDGHGNMKDFFDNNQVPDDNQQRQIPKIYGYFEGGVTGCAKGLRCTANLDFVFADHHISQPFGSDIGNLYFDSGTEGVPPLQQVDSESKDLSIYNYTYYVMQGAISEDGSIWNSKVYKLSTETLDTYLQRVKIPPFATYTASSTDVFFSSDYWGRASTQRQAAAVDNLPAYLDGSAYTGYNTFARCMAWKYNPGEDGYNANYVHGGIAWYIGEDEDTQKEFANIIKSSSTTWQLCVRFSNYTFLDLRSPNLSYWVFWPTVSSPYSMEELMTPIILYDSGYTGDDNIKYPYIDPNNDHYKWHSSAVITSDNEYANWQSLGLYPYGSKCAIGYRGMGVRFFEPVATGDTTDYPPGWTQYMLARFGGVVVEIKYKTENPGDIDEAWGNIYGYGYGSWITAFNNFYTVPSVYKSVGSNIDTGVGIIASLLIDRHSSETYSFLANGDDFDFKSFGYNLFPQIPVRLNITDEDMTIDDVAEQLGKQLPWTFCITASGRAKWVTTRCVTTNSNAFPNLHSTSISYEDLKQCPKFGLTDENEVINKLKIQYNWLPERGDDYYKDTEVFQNTNSQTQYGIRGGDKDFQNIHTYFAASGTINYVMDYFIEAGYANGTSTDKGLLSHQHNKIVDLVIPGTKWNALEIGDAFKLDETGFDARNLTLFGESVEDKIWLITDIKSTEDTLTIKEAIEIRQHCGFYYENPFG